MPVYTVEYQDLQYNPADKDSVLKWAESLRGKTLREIGLELNTIEETKSKDKGSFGKLLEFIAFQYKPNQDDGPDLPEANIEIKSLPLIKARNSDSLIPKERLTLHNVNWFDIVNETWENNSLRRKCSHMLIITDKYEKGIPALDLKIVDAFFLEFPLPQDEPTIKKDWLYVQDMALNGRAHEVSASKTTYLDIFPRGMGEPSPQPFNTDVPGKGRRFGLKRSYIRSVYESLNKSGIIGHIPRENTEKELSLEDLVRSRVEPFIGRTSEDLSIDFGVSLHSKDFAARLCDSMLGLRRGDRNDEFVRAGYIRKSISLELNSNLAEHISFPYIRCDSLLTESSWLDSLFREQITSRFCFMVWQKTETKRERRKRATSEPSPREFRGIVFAGIPEEVTDTDGRIVWDKTRFAYLNSDPSSLPGIGERGTTHYRFHVRPHATKTQKKTVLPNGTKITHQCFWIDSKYVLEMLYTNEYPIPKKLIDASRWIHPIDNLQQ